MRSSNGNTKNRIVLTVVAIVFAAFLLIPMILIVRESLTTGNGFTFDAYKAIFTGTGFGNTLRNSIVISLTSALITTLFAFCFAYAIHYTNIPKKFAKFLRLAVTAPMFLPTITYGFAIIYSFGKYGLFTRLFGGHQLFQIYGVPGLMIGYILFTLPVAFVLIQNTMMYIDKKYIITSKLLGDSAVKTFYTTVIRPLLGTLVISIIQCFFLSFTDYGIPMAVGGRTQVVATALYEQMLGAIPDFNNGSAIAIIMLLPSIAGIAIVALIERTNIRYRTVSDIPFRKNYARDISWGAVCSVISFFVLGIIASVIIVPCVKNWPYELTFTTDNFKTVFQDSELTGVYWNSIKMAFFTALFGTLLAYGSALVSTRSQLKARKLADKLVFITSTIPGMVLGIAYTLAFSGTALQNTFALLVFCTIIHYYSTPYLMMKNSLEKMDASWETTARLLGDSWIKTVARVITPNALGSLAEVFRYYFINAMVTVSAVIFIVGPDTSLLTTKIQELEHYQQFNDIFVLSIMILVTNLLVTLLTQAVTRYLNHQNRKGNVENEEEEYFEKGSRVNAHRGSGSLQPDGMRQLV
ncbi:MAG: ABC transporter permease [Eubacterium sp.]